MNPEDIGDTKNTFIEIRAGAGGLEAALFAADLFRMYTKFSDAKGLKMELVNAHEVELGGYKEVVVLVEGKGAYGNFQI